MPVVIFFVAHWYLSLFSQTFFHHRYGAHAAFKMSRGWERFFFIYSYVMQGSSYLSPKAYAIMHRIHHAYTDTDKDPHSPGYSKNLWDMMIQTWRFYSGIFYNKIQVEERFTKNVPEWNGLDKWAHSWANRLMWVGLYIAFYVYFNTPAWLYILLPVQILMSPVHGAVINWFAHKYGYTNFKVKNTSTNLFSIDLLMLGEAYHNNHHKRASSINFGVKWHEIDPVYPVILLFKRMGIIKLNTVALPERIADLPMRDLEKVEGELS